MNGLELNIRHRFGSAGFALDLQFQSDALITSLFGRSGSGKSTTLAMIAGLLSPQQGTIRFQGRTLFDSETSVDLPPEQREIGFVFQDHLLFPHLSVRKNLLYGRRRRTSANRDITFEKVAEVLELEPFLDQKPNTLSGGQQQRVALGRALLRNPSLLLMDEPLTGLDDALKSRILSYVERAVHEWSIPTVYVSHSLFEVQRLAHHVIAFENGRVLDQGPPSEILRHAPVLQSEDADRLVNLLRVRQVTRDQNGDWHGQVGDHVLSLPSLVRPAEEILVSFPAAAVGVSKAATEPTSVRNRLHGRVDHLVSLRDRILVQIDIGQPLWAEITHEAQRDIQLRCGESVTCLVKALAIRQVS